ncbi:hypothetical protein WJX72_005924 [[Myrmecia] bisecta]|uniref:Glutamine amidotransferase domain-containing protein n=1 Tax=[Myrmecia] bisecta TaxID=41462 RepID=A0AAW1P8Q6_9CHLO
MPSLSTDPQRPQAGDPFRLAPTRPNEAGKTVTKYAVLVTGHAPEHIEAEFGDAGTLFKQLLEDEHENEAWHVFYPADGHMPTDDMLQGYKGIVVSGSRADSFATDPWNMQLRALLKTAFDRQQRILGICFGDQLMSITLGGKVGRSEAGFEGGARTLKTTPAFKQQWFAEAFPHGWEFKLHETHNDRIMEVPDAISVLAYSENTPVQMCCSGDHFLGLQGHPDITPDTERIETGALPKDVGEAALQSMRTNRVSPEERAAVQKLVKTFLKGDHPRGLKVFR